MLPADILEVADHPESERGMEPDRAGVLRIADDREHLAKAARLRFRDEAGEQRPADAEPLGGRIDVDRVLDGEAIGPPRPGWPGLGGADHAPTGGVFSASRGPAGSNGAVPFATASP